MKFSLSIHKQYLKFFTLGLLTAFIMLLPGSAFSQEEQEPEEEINSGRSPRNEQSSDIAAPVVGGNPWENSAGSTIGTSTDEHTSPATTGPANRVGGRQGGTLSHGGGPGGNPDVPFDDNMNLVFLVAGVAFAFWIAKKKLAANAAVSNK